MHGALAVLKVALCLTQTQITTTTHTNTNNDPTTRNVTTLTYSADGAWLYAGTASGDVVTINAPRRAVQLVHPVASGGVGWTGLSPALPGRLLVAAGDGAICAFDHSVSVHSAPPLACVPGAAAAVTFVAGGGGRRVMVGTRHGGIYTLDLPLGPGGSSSNGGGSSIGGTSSSGGGGVSGTRTLSALPPWRAWAHAQQGPLLGMSWATAAVDAVATASADGSVCVWNTAVSETPGNVDSGMLLLDAATRNVQCWSQHASLSLPS